MNKKEFVLEDPKAIALLKRIAVALEEMARKMENHEMPDMQR
jgi:hypothetical protein